MKNSRWLIAAAIGIISAFFIKAAAEQLNKMNNWDDIDFGNW